MDLLWMKAVGYRIDGTKLSFGATSMPAVVGNWAGHDLYAIGDFLRTPGTNAIHSIIVGDTDPVGWIWYDQKALVWHVIDPTIPTSTEAPVATNVSRKSIDGKVNVALSTPGAFSNPWWCVTQVAVNVRSSSADYPVTCTVNPAFDSGITTNIPQSLMGGLPPASAVVTEVDGQAQPSDATPDGADGAKATQQRPVSTQIYPTSANGICTIWRGQRTEFDMSRIGQDPLSLDGNVCPIVLTAKDERILPDLVLTTNQSEHVQSLREGGEPSDG